MKTTDRLLPLNNTKLNQSHIRKIEYPHVQQTQKLLKSISPKLNLTLKSFEHKI